MPRDLEKRKAYLKEYISKNKDRIYQHNRENYAKLHPNSKRKRKNEPSNKKEQFRLYIKRYRAKYVNARIANNLRSRLGAAIRGKVKSDTTLNLLGCSIEYLKLYIESKFQSGMSWYNYGKNGWHIDHIIPCISFDLSIPKAQRDCFHYTNLQPLWAKDNYIKHSKLNYYTTKQKVDEETLLIKNVIKFTTNAETEQVKKAFITFIDSQKDAIGGFLTTIIKDTGASADAQIKVEGEEISIYQLAPDKGYVLAETGNPELPIQLGKYMEIPEGNKYVNQEKDLTVLYLKKAEGVADVKLGVFKSINDAVKEFNSESVKQVLKNLAEKEAKEAKIEAKTENRLKRLGKDKVETTSAE